MKALIGLLGMCLIGQLGHGSAPLAMTHGAETFAHKSINFKQPQTGLFDTTVCAIAFASEISAEGELQDDPAQAVYKAGYASILAKKWQEARKSFEFLAQKYPKSKYVDAATYWMAYSYMQTEQKKAAELYRKFIQKYPESSYLNDAVADLEKLGFSGEIRPPAAPSPPEKYEQVEALYEKAEQFERQRARLEARASRMAERSHTRDRSSDPDIQFKVEAIHALSRNTDDPDAYNTIKGIALDTSAHWELRTAALQGLHRFKNRDNMQALLTIAGTGGESELRQQAIITLGHTASKGDSKTIDLLTGVVRNAKEPKSIRTASLIALTEMEYPGVIPILEDIVKNEKDRELRQEALFYIARAGRADEARTISLLKSVASDTNESVAIRETAIHALAQLAGKQAFSLLKGIATSDPDKKMRLSALYALVKQRSGPVEEIEALVKGIATQRSEDEETRIAALYSLKELQQDTYIDLYRDMALHEKDVQVRQAAVHLLAQSIKNKAEALSTLTEIYGNAPADERETREAALYGIAEVGNQKAVEFLMKVARNDPDYEMRRRAIYFLGSVGGNEAKAALMEILKK